MPSSFTDDADEDDENDTLKSTISYVSVCASICLKLVFIPEKIVN